MLRTALLAASKHTESGQVRALLPLAGRSVLRWQVDFAIRMGCTRIVCLCDAPEPEVLALQLDSEALGHEFHAIRSNAQLAALVRSGEEVLVILDGLVIDRGFADRLIGVTDRFSPTIYTLRREDWQVQDAPDDFERIDAERFWAGLMIMRADRMQTLADMPADSNAMSVLLRIALQSGVRCVEFPHEYLSDGDLLLAGSVDRVAERERNLIGIAASPMTWSGPGQAMANLLAKRLKIAGAARSLEIAGGLGVLLLCVAAALSWTGYGTAGIAIAALGFFSGACSSSTYDLRGRLFGRPPCGFPVSAAQSIGFVLGILAAIGALDPTLEQLALVALPILTFGLLEIAARDGYSSYRAFWSDRALHMAGLSAASAFGLLAEAVALLGMAALGHILLHKREN